MRIVDNLGYKATQANEGARDEDSLRKEKELKRLRIELLAAIVLSAPLLLNMIFNGVWCGCAVTAKPILPAGAGNTDSVRHWGKILPQRVLCAESQKREHGRVDCDGHIGCILL